MTCRRCEGLHYITCPRASVKTVCALSCDRCHGKHMVPCPDCEAHQEHAEIHTAAEADSILAEMNQALGPLAKVKKRMDDCYNAAANGDIEKANEIARQCSGMTYGEFMTERAKKRGE